MSLHFTSIKKTFFRFLILTILSPPVFSQGQSARITIDASKELGELKYEWAFFGYDEPNFTYMRDGQKLLSELAELSPVPVYVRAHNLLTSGDGTGRLKWGSTNVFTEDENGNPVYDWTIVDKILDTYIQRGMKPLVELGFMPKALSKDPDNYEHQWGVNQKYDKIFTGWTTPPTDYEKWGELIFQLVKHCRERYGTDEVNTWLWEPWNEPNIGYWSGTFDEYCKLYDFSVDAVKRACPDCTFGGPHTTGPGWDKAYEYLVRFLEHCIKGKNYVTGKKGSPIDFVAFHAKGQPKIVDDHIRMNMGTQLNDIAKGFEAVNLFPELKDIPIIIGECDPEGCAACSETMNPQNGYRNGTMYSSYTASSFAKIYELMDKYDVNLKGILSWSFEFENQKWFDGFRDLATNGVDKPVLNVFRMYGMMSGQRILAESDKQYLADQVIKNGVQGATSDIDAFATKNDQSFDIMVWNYHDDDLAREDAKVKIVLKGVEDRRYLAHHYRVDDAHSNSFEVWKKMGKPQDISKEQYATLEKAGQLKLLRSPRWINAYEGTFELEFMLPAKGVSLIKIVAE